MQDLLQAMADSLPGGLAAAGYDLTAELGVSQAIADAGANVLPQMAGVVQAATDACAPASLPGPGATVPPPTDTTAPPDVALPAATQEPPVDPAAVDLGASGAALLPALEDARHAAFMGIMGRRR